MLTRTVVPAAGKNEMEYIQWSNNPPPEKRFWSKNYEPYLIITSGQYLSGGCKGSIETRLRNNPRKCPRLKQEMINISEIQVLKTNCDDETYSLQKQFVYFWCDETNNIMFSSNIEGLVNAYSICVNGKVKFK